MARLYSNVNGWRRHSNLGRINDQQLRSHTRPMNAVTEDTQAKAKFEAELEGQDRHVQTLMQELRGIRSIMEARPDKRCRPEEISTRLFVAYRKHKFGFRKRSIKKRKQHTV